MNDFEKSIINTIIKLSEKVKTRNFPLYHIPIDDLCIALKCSFNYTENNEDLVDEIVTNYKNILTKLSIINDFDLFVEMLHLMANSMGLWFKTIGDIDSLKKLSEEIICKYNKYELDEDFISKCTNLHLIALQKYADIHTYKKIFENICQINIKRIKQKEKIKIAFLIVDSSTWIFDTLYNKLCQDPGFDPYIIISRYTNVGNHDIRYQHSIILYEACLSYFSNKNYNVIGMHDLNKNKDLTFEEAGKPDIIFHGYQYFTDLPSNTSALNFPLNILNVFVNYGVPVVNDKYAIFRNYAHPLLSLCWKALVPYEYHAKEVEKHSYLKGSNNLKCGFLRHDEFFLSKPIDYGEIWNFKDISVQKTAKKIIYAPHYSIRNDGVAFGNFDKIYMDILKYAKDNSKTTSWIFRPHRSLGVSCIDNGLFKNLEEYNEYKKMWDELPNGRVIDDGSATDIFLTSDAMILDSASFLVDYLYAHKPMLLLTRKEQMFNDFGKELTNTLYKADGSDMSAIIEFLEDVVINENDYMKNLRESFYDKHLDYLATGKKLPSDFMYHFLVSELRMIN